MFTLGAASDAFSLFVVFVTVVTMGVALAIALILMRVIPSEWFHGWCQLVDTKVRTLHKEINTVNLIVGADPTIRLRRERFLLATNDILFVCSILLRNARWTPPRAAIVPNFHLPMRSYEVKNRNARWTPPHAAIIPSLHLPMRSYEVKNRTSTDDIKSLRLITAIKTPYLPDGRFDLEAYDSLVNMQIEDGVDGVIVGGTTGEGQLMSWDEHIMLIGHTINCFGTSIKVIGNTGSNSTREAVHATEQGFAVGMHAALHINPYYGKTSLEGMVAHFQCVLPMGPTIIYNVPSRTGQDIPPRVIHSIADSTNFAGIKECVGHDRVKEYTKNGITVWSGNDDECHDSKWDHDATGVISVTSNLVPGLMHELLSNGKNPSLNKKLLPLINWLFGEPNPIGVNTALAQLGVIRPIFRLPYVPLPLAKRVEFVNIVKEIGREHFIGEKDVQVLEDDDFLLVGRY
ncbi:4-hydroxy-tetrahydrodipicolinate synthase, chloroplastic-like protein [Tanacetum coccineum]|uniref:4-hydroxy-tetrahydrodipicolinate synthase n=1 Tax=Tanacetum coccineum TaxID=301880 RepID=A0ABQ5HU19_9ASTR